MSMRYQAGILTASYFPLKTPSAPTIGAATQASSTSVSVTFTAPTDIGGGAISSYVVVSSPGNIIASGASSPITVTGLTPGTAYSFRVFANNAFGNSPASASSNVVTPLAVGQEAFISAGTYSWIAPAGVTSVCVVCVGAGQAGGGFQGSRQGAGGGGLAYKNNIAVTPGNAYTVVVGAGGPYTATGGVAGGLSSFTASFGTCTAGGGSGGTGGSPSGVYDGGGNGGNGSGSSGGGGGGAGGYSGAGSGGGSGAAGAGGAGAGGNNAGTRGIGGGGVGILGQGANGTANGGGGSGGTTGATSPGSGGSVEFGGTYGGGGGGVTNDFGGAGGVGAVRIIWGSGRAFPSTNTGNL